MNRTCAVRWFEKLVMTVAMPLAILLSRLAYGADDSAKDAAKANRSIVESDGAHPARTDLFGDSLPAGAAVRLGTTRFRVTGRKEGLAFSADDVTLVMNGDSRRLVLVDALTGSKVLEISTGEQWANAMRLTPDRSSVLTFGHEFIKDPPQNVQTAQRFDLASGKMLSKVPLDKAFGEVVAIDASGRIAITRGGNGLLAVWDMIAGKELLSHKIGKGRINAAALSPVVDAT